jgi:hypothetical protein
MTVYGSFRTRPFRRLPPRALRSPANRRPTYTRRLWYLLEGTVQLGCCPSSTFSFKQPLDQQDSMGALSHDATGANACVYKLYNKTWHAEDHSTLQRAMRGTVSTFSLNHSSIASMLQGNPMPVLNAVCKKDYCCITNVLVPVSVR